MAAAAMPVAVPAVASKPLLNKAAGRAEVTAIAILSLFILRGTQKQKESEEGEEACGGWEEAAWQGLCCPSLF